MTNVEKYQVILKDKTEHPEKALQALCKDQGVSYQSYNNWYKKYVKTGLIKASKPPRSNGGPSGKVVSQRPKAPMGPEMVTITIPLHELVNAYQEGKDTINIPRSRVFQTLSVNDQTRFDSILGRLTRELADRKSDKQNNNRPIKTMPTSMMNPDGDGH